MAFCSVVAVTPTRGGWIPYIIGMMNARGTRHGGQYLARTTDHEEIKDALPASVNDQEFP